MESNRTATAETTNVCLYHVNYNKGFRINSDNYGICVCGLNAGRDSATSRAFRARLLSSYRTQITVPVNYSLSLRSEFYQGPQDFS